MTAKTRLRSRPAVAADITAFFGRNTPRSVRARVIEQDGIVVGVAGYYVVGGVAVVFSDASADLPQMTIWRESKAMMESIKIPAICISSEGSGPFLERLGWKHVGPSDDGEVYSWQPFS